MYLIRPPLTFLGIDVPRESTRFSFVGVPFDMTSTFVSGSSFAPYYIRLVSRSLETYSIRHGIDVEDVGIYDEGDVAVSPGAIDSSFRAIEVVAEELIREGRFAVFVGGEHLITYPITKALVRGLSSSLCVVTLDAHADFRNEYLGNKLSHACVMRRVSEVISPNNIFLVGVRAMCSDEVRELRRSRVRYVTSLDIIRYGLKHVMNKLNDFISTCKYVYLSVDIDVLDPAYAPGISTPEPEGLTPTQVIDIVSNVAPNAVSMDVVEVVPREDQGYATTSLATKIILESITSKFARSLTSNV